MLSRDSILEAGLQILDEGGPDALSMRALARRLGVTATAIYYHYEGRDELLDAIVDQVCARIVAPVPESGPWDERLRALMTSLVDEAAAHPAVATWAITHYARRPPVLRIHELILAVLRAGGFDPDAAMQVKGALLRLAVGHLVLRTADSGPTWRQLPADEFPEHQAAGPAIDRFDPDQNYHAAVALLLTAYRRR